MSAKEYLAQYGRIERNINRMKEELKHCREMRSGLTPSYSPTISGKGNISNPVTQAYMMIEKWEEKIAAEIVRLCDLREEIRGVIAQVTDPLQREVLDRIYIQQQSLGKAGYEMHYSFRQIERIHEKGLENLQIPERCQVMSGSDVL